MYSILHMVEDTITDGMSDDQIIAVAIGTDRDLKETKETIKNVRRNLKFSTKRCK